jgi:hypothetical protein
MAKRKRTVLPASEARVAHTRQKAKPRFVSKAHRQEQVDDPLEFASVQQVLARPAAKAKRSQR